MQSKQINVIINVTRNEVVSSLLNSSRFGVGEALRQIAEIETGGYRGDPYMAQGTTVTSGLYKGEKAQGKYQIMPSNWAEWSQAAGLEKNAPMSPENQERVAAHRVGKYYKEFNGDTRFIKLAWYTGLGNARRYRDTGDKRLLSGMDVNKRLTGGQYAGFRDE